MPPRTETAGGYGYRQSPAFARGPPALISAALHASARFSTRRLGPTLLENSVIDEQGAIVNDGQLPNRERRLGPLGPVKLSSCRAPLKSTVEVILPTNNLP